MEAERGIDMGAVEVDRPEPVLRATGGSDEPLSISDTGDRTLICCWKEVTALKSYIKTDFNILIITLTQISQVICHANVENVFLY